MSRPADSSYDTRIDSRAGQISRSATEAIKGGGSHSSSEHKPRTSLEDLERWFAEPWNADLCAGDRIQMRVLVEAKVNETVDLGVEKLRLRLTAGYGAQ